MAKVISPVWSIIRGSIAGTTYLAGPNNTIIARQKTAPVNPNTDLQGLIRTSMQEAASLWKEVMSQSDRDKWDLYGATLSKPGPLGPYPLTGQQAFISAYVTASWAQNLGATITPTTTAPEISGFVDTGGYQLVDRVNAGTGFQLNLVNYSTEAVVLCVNVSGAWEASKNFFKGPWDTDKNQFFSFAASTSGSVDVDVALAGKKYFVKVKAIVANPANRTQQPVILSGISTTV